MGPKAKRNQHKRVLVLNADYRAISVTNWQSAITSEFKGISDTIIDYSNDSITLPGDFCYPAPAVIKLKKHKKVHKRKVPFSRKNVFIRDRLRCQYCGNRFHFRDLTFDHVIPRAKWKSKKSPTTWTNIVSCCYDCNHRKAHHTLDQSGMTLIKTPVEPDPFLYINGLAPWTLLQPEWIDYIPSHYKELLEVAPAK